MPSSGHGRAPSRRGGIGVSRRRGGARGAGAGQRGRRRRRGRPDGRGGVAGRASRPAAAPGGRRRRGAHRARRPRATAGARRAAAARVSRRTEPIPDAAQGRRPLLARGAGDGARLARRGHAAARGGPGARLGSDRALRSAPRSSRPSRVRGAPALAEEGVVAELMAAAGRVGPRSAHAGRPGRGAAGRRSMRRAFARGPRGFSSFRGAAKPASSTHRAHT